MTVSGGVDWKNWHLLVAVVVLWALHQIKKKANNTIDGLQTRSAAKMFHVMQRQQDEVQQALASQQ